MGVVPTRRVRALATGHEMLINASDFDPARHEALDAGDPAKLATVQINLNPCPRCGFPGPRSDGPTFEEFVRAGYRPGAYPPSGYAERGSDGLTAYRTLSAEDREQLDAQWRAEHQGDELDEINGAQNQATESTAPAVDTTPGSIATVNMEQALALVAAAQSMEQLDTLEAAEKANVKKAGGRVGVLKAIEERRAAVTG